MEVKFSEVQKLVRVAFPGAKSRRPVVVEGRETYRVRDFWDGGSRCECVPISRVTGQVLDLIQVGFRMQTMGNPFNQNIGEITMTEDFIIVEHVISCGKDKGYRIVTHPKLSDMTQAFKSL